MDSEFKQYSDELTELLGLKNNPVAVTFTNEPVNGPPQKARMCQAVKGAGAGKSFVLDKDTSLCPGGTWHCGLSEKPSGDYRRGIQKFLTQGEKLTGSIVSFWRMLELTPGTPTGLSDRILLGPLDESVLRPDIVLFVCNPEQSCRLLALDQYWDGIPPEIQMSGSLCYTAISYPIVTGRTNVTFGDWTARRMTKFKSDVVFLSVPYERMANLIKAIPNCSAGTAEFKGFEPQPD
ncbi:MAG: DUF169 domain-containing protein [Actinobacteria bacterium]|nr:DUF169 domain-containing protein [Actinomycetota bacterium]